MTILRNKDLAIQEVKICLQEIFLLILPDLVVDLSCCYQKYMIDKKYHSYWNILFFYGLIYFIIDLIEFIIDIKNKSLTNSYLFANQLLK